MGYGWTWLYMPPSHGESGRIELYSPSGTPAATVFLHFDGRGYNWFIWDENGAGGENSQEPTIDAAVAKAESAVRRWGRVTG